MAPPVLPSTPAIAPADRSRDSQMSIDLGDSLVTVKPESVQIEEAWPGGPMRKVGSGNGKPSKYVCGQCRHRAQGLYRLKRSSSQAEEWLCSECKRATLPHGTRPIALQAYWEGVSVHGRQ